MYPFGSYTERQDIRYIIPAGIEEKRERVFMSSDFVERAHSVREMMFSIGEARFILCNEDERGCSIAEWDRPEKETLFRNIDELIHGFQFGGRPLGEYVDAIVIEDFIRFPETDRDEGEEITAMQKQTLELFLERGAISREQYEKSLGELEWAGRADEKPKKTGEALDKRG